MRMLLLGIVIGFVLGAVVAVAPRVLAQAPPPIQELIPLPGPGDQQPGQLPGQQQGEDCPILFYHNGQLYRLRPGQGQDGQGRPGSPPEFFQLDPYQGPPIPGLPIPQMPGPQGPVPQVPGQPNFRPTTPRS